MNIDCKSAFFELGMGQFRSNFHVEGDISHKPFLHGKIDQ